jgi:two-component sensor histidine kinase
VFETTFEPIVIPARDATTIGIVLGELMTNALKHAFPDNRAGCIWATMRDEGEGQIVLCVADDGIGMPEVVAQQDGGLGSMIVKQLAHQFGGAPQYAPRHGGGTTVTVSLPGLGSRES